MKFKEIRCPNVAGHHGKYETCGALLGALVSGTALYRCPRCGFTVVAEMKQNHIEFSEPKHNKNGKINMERIWRVMHERR